MKRSIHQLALLTTLAGLPLGPAYAQAPSAAAPAASAASAEDSQRIIVTANRRREEAQKVSGVVQAISGENLRKDGIVELRNLQTAIPGMSIANQEGNIEIYIRGVGSANNTELGDPAAAPHINGVYIPRPRGLGVMFFDIDRVEVNKGPQGTLYGRNALAGTLNLITTKPKLGESSGYMQAELANRNGLGGEAAFNMPLGDRMALRGAAQYTQKDYGFQNRVGRRPNQHADAVRARGGGAQACGPGRELRFAPVLLVGSQRPAALHGHVGRRQRVGHRLPGRQYQ
jgi:iron complex outermembrane recepter protein